MKRAGKPLAGKFAVAAGATRGAGRGIARALGEAGAFVHCTGRSIRGNPSPYGRPGFMRSETMLQGFGVTEDNWRDGG